MVAVPPRVPFSLMLHPVIICLSVRRPSCEEANTLYPVSVTPDTSRVTCRTATIYLRACQTCFTHVLRSANHRGQSIQAANALPPLHLIPANHVPPQISHSHAPCLPFTTASTPSSSDRHVTGPIGVVLRRRRRPSAKLSTPSSRGNVAGPPTAGHAIAGVHTNAISIPRAPCAPPATGSGRGTILWLRYMACHHSKDNGCSCAN